MVMVLNIIGFAFLGAGLFCAYMLVRNHYVFEYRKNLLWSDSDAYYRLPEYEHMLYHWWVWPLSRFLK